MRFLFLMLILTVSLFCKSVNGYVKEIRAMSDDQKKVLVLLTMHGLNHNEYRYILAAIAFKESRLGENVVSHGDGVSGSYGVMQVQLFYDMKSKGIKHTEANKKAEIKKHINNHNYNVSSALANLKFWEKTHGNDVRKILACYNAGTNGHQSSRGLAYADDVIKRAKAIKHIVETSGLLTYIKAAYDGAKIMRSKYAYYNEDYAAGYIR